MKFLVDLQGAKCIRKGFDFSETTHLVCAPARFQARLEGVPDNRLVGSLLFSSKCNEAKWVNTKDPSKSSLPLCFVLNNAKTVRDLGLVEFPSTQKLISESDSAKFSLGYEYSTDVMAIFQYCALYTSDFYARETHATNDL